MQSEARLQALTDECEQAQSKIDQWAAVLLESLEQQQTNQQTVIAAGKENIRALGKREQQRLDEVKALQSKHEKEEQAMLTAKAKLMELKASKAAMPAEIEAQKAEMARLQQLIAEHERTHQRRLHEARYKTAELSQGLDYFKEHLGLEFRRLEGNRLRFIFRKIDPNNHARKFIFSVYVNDLHKYELTECEPAIDNEKQLLDELNESNDFSLFVRRIRKSFQEKI